MASDLNAAPRRSHSIRLIAAAVALAAIALVIVLATSRPATTRAADSPLVGRAAPAVRGETIDGEQFDLDLLRGQWVVVNFFATWCVPCREEHPELVRFQNRHRRQGDATVIGVIYDDDVEAVREFREAEGGDWPMVIDPDGRVALDFAVTGVPESFLVDPDGRVAARIVGGVRVEDLEALLQEAGGAGRDG